jgi:hypothetical protein
VDCIPILMALAGQNQILVFLVVGFFFLRRLPWLIAAFRVAIVQGEKTRLSGRARHSRRSSPAGTGSGRSEAEAQSGAGDLPARVVARAG